jgi:hypothetical protein
VSTYTAAARDLAREIDVDLTDRTAMQMIVCGLHSGFPPCCITFFVKTWWPFFVAIYQMPARERSKARSTYDAYLRQTRGTNYVPCPRCVADRRFVKVKACDCEAKRARRDRARRSRA